MVSLTLFYMPTCPYCYKVITFMQNNGISLEMKNTQSSPAVKQELISIGGKSQVPCLVIDGKALYESNDIIEWLKNNYKK